jgi:glyoxylase-like metal-dependent hydrolase (beta-lactamase superfamily II)/rhodanese-related sulfurtransferase
MAMDYLLTGGRIVVRSFVSEGLGHSSYLVELGDGSALVIDAARLPTEQRTYAEQIGLTIAWAADTHTHADYISGSPELAGDGAVFLAPAAAGLSHRHRGLTDGDVLELGNYQLTVIATPGHTPDHLSYLLADDDGPVVLFSGGSLMVGAVGRTDLLGDDRREELARDLYRALRDRVLTLPDDLAVYPTHGAGSFCSAPAGGERTTTIGHERVTNPMLQAAAEDDFVDALVSGLGSFPTYFRRLPTINRHPVARYDEVPKLPSVGLEEFDRLVGQGALIVDARPALDFAAAHIPGALSIALRPAFASWLGWVADPDRPLVFVLADDQDEADLVRQALTVGYEHLAGRLAGGLETWSRAGRPVQTVEIIEPDHIDRPVLDVRQLDEYSEGHVPGSTHIELGSLPTAALPAGPVATMCGHNERSMTAASILQQGGVTDVAAVRGGYNAWADCDNHQPEPA